MMLACLPHLSDFAVSSGNWVFGKRTAGTDSMRCPACRPRWEVGKPSHESAQPSQGADPSRARRLAAPTRGCWSDITEVVSAQRAKLPGSEVARRVAHEIKNPLTPSSSSAELAQAIKLDSKSARARAP